MEMEMFPRRAQNVHFTNATKEVRSRWDLLAWVNETLKSNFKRLEDLCTGAAYCQLTEMLFPGTINLQNVYLLTNLEHESIENFKILQQAFKKLGVKHDMPIDRLAKGHYLDNFEFLQWFNRFFEVNDKGLPLDPIGTRQGRPIGYGPSTFRQSRSFAKTKSLRISKSTASTPASQPRRMRKTKQLPSRGSSPIRRQTSSVESTQSTPMSSPVGSHVCSHNRTLSSPSICHTDFTKTSRRNILEMEKEKLEEQITQAKNDRAKYFAKLVLVEKLVTENQGGKFDELSKKVLDKIYETKEGFERPSSSK